jgi:hypothetical protein
MRAWHSLKGTVALDGFGEIFIFRITNKDFKDFLVWSKVYWIKRRMRVNKKNSTIVDERMRMRVNPKISAIVDVANNRGVSL